VRTSLSGQKPQLCEKLTIFREQDFAKIRWSVFTQAGSDAASDLTLGALRRNGLGTGNSFLAPPSWKSSGSAQTLGEPGTMIAELVRQRLGDKLFSKHHLFEAVGELSRSGQNWTD
jgi:hypothetical protein